jgi:DNA-binding SARP family transcriptional activator
MVALTVRMFGRFDVCWGDQTAATLKTRAARELLGYLVLHRGHPQRRETLATLLWKDAAPAQGRKYLRQALWQLQSALRPLAGCDGVQPLEVDPEWIQLNNCGQLVADVARFEEAVHSCHGIPGGRLDDVRKRQLEEAVRLYRGDLLEGWYQDWCALERERLQHDFVDVLEKLVCACEARRETEQGLAYAKRMLALDPADEQAYRHLMRLRAQAGNRTRALREFQRCERVLVRELGVKPSPHTLALYESIRDGRGAPDLLTGDILIEQLPGLAELLRRAQHLFADLDARLRQEADMSGANRTEPY